ncbi:MAG: radical SAM protein [archaeon]|nr:radical SAM protein [archaeon]
MKRLYLVPVRDACNSNCSFCYMKEKKIDVSIPQYMDFDKLEEIIEEIQDEINEVEITGGGEPLIHKEIGRIIELFKAKKIYTKMYTNGFLLKEIPLVDEINLSRVHWDSQINNRFYHSSQQNDLEAVLKHYQKFAKKIRMQTILLKGAIDSADKALEFIERYEDLVDVFMFRTLFPECDLEKEHFVPYFDLNHPKVKMDQTLDAYEGELFFLDTSHKLRKEFYFGVKR